MSHGDGFVSHGNGFVSHGDGFVSHGERTNHNIVLREELRDSTDLCPDLSCLTTSLVGLVVA